MERTSWTAPTSPNVGASDKRADRGGRGDLHGCLGRRPVLRHSRVALQDADHAVERDQLVRRDQPERWHRLELPDGCVRARATDIWAVGYPEDPATGGFKSLILRWNGTAWSVVASPNPHPSGDNVLNGVSALTSSTAWAVGYHTAGGEPSDVRGQVDRAGLGDEPSPNPGDLEQSPARGGDHRIG